MKDPISTFWPFYTIMPDLLSDKLTQLSLPSLNRFSFMTDRQQQVRLGKLTPRTLMISTGAPQGCILSPLLFSLYMTGCTSKVPSVKILMFAGDTTVTGRIRTVMSLHIEARLNSWRSGAVSVTCSLTHSKQCR